MIRSHLDERHRRTERTNVHRQRHQKGSLQVTKTREAQDVGMALSRRERIKEVHQPLGRRIQD